jgi:hypothetical protein
MYNAESQIKRGTVYVRSCQCYCSIPKPILVDYEKSLQVMPQKNSQYILTICFSQIYTCISISIPRTGSVIRVH